MPKFKPGDKVRIFSKIDYNPFLNSYKGKTVTVISAHDWIVDEKNTSYSYLNFGDTAFSVYDKDLQLVPEDYDIDTDY